MGKKKDNKKDLRNVQSLAVKYHMTAEERYRFGDYIHDLKDRGVKGSGKNGDFTYKQLDRLARVIMGRLDEDDEDDE